MSRSAQWRSSRTSRIGARSDAAIRSCETAFEQPKPLLVRRQRRRLRDAGKPLAQRRNQAGEGWRTEAQVRTKLLGGDGTGVCLDRLDEGAVRRRPLALVAAAGEDARPVPACQLRELLRGARLPDPGLADDHDERSLARACPVEQADDPPHLLVPADERSGRQERGRLLRLVLDLGNADRVGKALQCLRSEVAEAERAAAGEEPRHGARAQDLSGLRSVAEPACGDDRRAEVAAASAAHDLADVEADAHAQALAVDRPHRPLLHRDRAADRVRGRREGRHLTVAEPLELLAAARGERFRQHAAVALEDALGPLVAQALHEDGRVDDVGEQDGRDRPSCQLGHAAGCSSRPHGGSTGGRLAPSVRGRLDSRACRAIA